MTLRNNRICTLHNRRGKNCYGENQKVRKEWKMKSTEKVILSTAKTRTQKEKGS
jgi:hypothetical protein